MTPKMTPKYDPGNGPKNDPPKWPFKKIPPDSCTQSSRPCERVKTEFLSSKLVRFSKQMQISQLLEEIIHQNFRWEVGQNLSFEDDIKTCTSWRIKTASHRNDFITQVSSLSSRDSFAISGTPGTAMVLEICHFQLDLH